MSENELDSSREVLGKEIEHLRTAHDIYIEETRKLERYAILVSGLTWSWCVANADNYAFNFLIWFPTIACNLFGMRAWGIHQQSKEVREYIASRERELGLGENGGWASLQIQQSKGKDSKSAKTAKLFWAIVCLGTFAMPCLYLHHRT